MYFRSSLVYVSSLSAHRASQPYRCTLDGLDNLDDAESKQPPRSVRKEIEPRAERLSQEACVCEFAEYSPL